MFRRGKLIIIIYTSIYIHTHTYKYTDLYVYAKAPWCLFCPCTGHPSPVVEGGYSGAQACQPVPQLATCVAEGPLRAYNALVQWAGMAAGEEYDWV